MIRKASIILALLLPLSAGLSPAAGERPVVVTTTTMIGSMVELLAGHELEVRLLIPPAACPGHFDLKPADAVGLSRAVLIIRHDYQGYLDRKLDSQNPEMEIAALETPGHFVIPANYISALHRIKEILEERFPELSGYLDQSCEKASSRIEQAEREVRARIAGNGLPGTRALASVRQAGFLRWAGMEVVATLPNSPEELSVFQLKRLVDSARQGRVSLVVGNLQGGNPAVAGGIAEQSDVPFCILSNFPGTNERNTTYFSLLKDNIDLLVETLTNPENP